MALLLVPLLLTSPLVAHTTSDSYLRLEIEPTGIHGTWDLALPDLELAIGLDENGDGSITPSEIDARQPAIEDYALSRLKLESDTHPLRLEVKSHRVELHFDGAYASLELAVHGPVPRDQITVEYQFLFDLHPMHRGLLSITRGQLNQTAILTPLEPRQTLTFSTPNPLREFARFTAEGVWHIWIGFDHILFLIALLLPSVLRHDGRHWIAEPFFRPAFLNVVRIVTAFTLAHSITLTLAALDIVHLPGRGIEVVIAASVALAALNNLFVWVRDRSWIVAFAFGLIHGFGFATVLGELDLPVRSTALALGGFNLGVELGQLAIVGLFLPLAYRLRSRPAYHLLALRGGSCAIAFLGLAWMTERCLDLQVLPF